MIGEAEVGIGAEHKDFAARDDNLGVLFGRDRRKIGINAFGPCLLGRCITSKFLS